VTISPNNAQVQPRPRRRFARATLAVALALVVLMPSTVSADRWYETPRMLGAIDASRQPMLAAQANVGWDRVLFLWQEIQPNGPGDWYLDRYLAQTGQTARLRSGLPAVAVVQGTPGWAAGNWRDGASGVPTGLDLPVDDPNNNFGRFMLRLSSTFKGRISGWLIWNEPDFRQGESGDWWTWSGDTRDFFSLIRTGYRAVKKSDPAATVVFSPTTYFADAVNGREQFLDRVLREGQRDPEAAKNGFYFDAVGANIYCSLDVLYRVRSLYAEILTRYKLEKPIWLTETNCPVYNDAHAPIEPHHHISTTEQAAFLIHSVALGRAAGYQRIGWYAMQDVPPSTGVLDRWGLLRSDASPRPAYRAFQVASRYLGGSEVSARLASIGDGGPGGWTTGRVILDDPPQRRRVQVLWRNAAGGRTVLIQPSSNTAFALDAQGARVPVKQVGNQWEIQLPIARVPQSFDPPGFLSVGDPILLIEEQVAIEQSPRFPAMSAR
jgi:hypothetical protein